MSWAPPCIGQKTSGGSGSQQQQSSSSATQGGGGPLPGLSYADHDWPQLLKAPTVNNGRVVLCFKLKYTNSASQPFVLERVPATLADGSPSIPLRCEASGKAIKDIPDDDEREQCQQNESKALPTIKGHWNACSTLNIDNPIQMRNVLAVEIDASEINTDDRRLRLLNINVTNQQGNPLNATPVRPSFSSAASSSQNAGGDRVYFLTWPYELPGDIIPTVSVNAIYTPPLPGAPWRPNTFYPAGSVVTSEYSNGHYYTAVKGGISSDITEPAFLVDPLPQIKDGDLVWVDSGTTLSSGAKATAWIATHYYCIGDIVFDPYNGHYYTALNANVPASGGSCTDPGAGVATAMRSGAVPADPFPIEPPALLPGQTFRVYDGPVLWILQEKVTGAQGWVAGTEYKPGEIVKDAMGTHEYLAKTKGVSGPKLRQPFFPIAQMASVREGGPGLAGVIADLSTSANDTEYQVRLGLAFRQLARDQYDLITKNVPAWSASAKSDLLKLLGGNPTALFSGIDPTTWLDIGTSPPASVASGQPTDQTVSLLNLTLPQVHSLYYYNLVAGVIVSSVRVPNLATQSLGNCNTSGCDFKFVKQGSNVLVDPVLLLTWYPVPFDAERPYRVSDLKHVGASFGLSLSSPASNFYVGASAEIQRNVQLVGGFNVAKISQLTVDDGTTVHVTGGTPSTPTNQHFGLGGFIGLTFNIGGFVQSLFGGGGKPSGQ